MTINDVLNFNHLGLRFKDHYVIILKSGCNCFSLGEATYRSYVTGELDLTSFVYTNMCLKEVCQFKVIKKCEYNLIKMYIDNEDLQAEIYLMEDRDYNKRIEKEKLR